MSHSLLGIRSTPSFGTCSGIPVSLRSGQILGIDGLDSGLHRRGLFVTGPRRLDLIFRTRVLGPTFFDVGYGC